MFEYKKFSSNLNWSCQQFLETINKFGRLNSGLPDISAQDRNLRKPLYTQNISSRYTFLNFNRSYFACLGENLTLKKSMLEGTKLGIGEFVSWIHDLWLWKCFWSHRKSEISKMNTCGCLTGSNKVCSFCVNRKYWFFIEFQANILDTE